ncbi:Ig-like domain-containing protein [Herpetosiphon gulosus]
MIDTWFQAKELDLTAWYKRYDAANYSPQVIVKSAPTISLLGYPSLLLIDPPSQTQRGSINVLAQLDGLIVRIAYPLTDGGQHQTEFLALLQSFAHAKAPSRVSRLPTRDQLPAITPESPTSSCCGWVDPNSNTYPCNGGNCTWWAKYKRPDIGNSWGDALGWRNRARQEGFAVDTVARVGAIAVYQPGVYIGQNLWAGSVGHVAYVEAVGANGSFTISDMSYERGCQYGNNGVLTIQSQQTNNENLVFIYAPNVAPNPPSLLEPSHTSAINRLNPTLRWQDMGDPDNYPNPHRDYTVEIWKTDQSWSQSWGWTTNPNWQPTLPNEGSYAWRVLAGDGSVGSDWSPTWNFIADTTVPTGGYTHPVNDSATRLSVDLRGTASDNLSGVDHVNFTAHYDGEWHVIHTDSTAPYEYTWDLSGVSDQLILLGYDIYDQAGNVALAPQGVLTMYKDTVAPTGGYTQPANDVIVQDSLVLRGTASDNLSGVDHVNFTAHYDGEWHVIHTDSTAPYEYTWDLSGVSDQLILLGYDIYDQAGNVALAPQGVLTIHKVSQYQQFLPLAQR